MNKYSKFVVALAGAAVVIVGRALGVTSWEYLDLVTVLTALGVYTIPNAS